MSAHLFSSAIRARDEKRFEDAITILTTLIDSDPTHMDRALRARSYTHRGHILDKYLNRPDSAMCDLDKAIDIDGNLPEVYYYKALALENSWKNYHIALEYYSKAISLDPCNSAYWTDRALLYKDFLKEYQKCIEDFDQALKYKQSGYYLSQQAHAYTLLGDVDKAQEFLEKGQALSPRLRIHKYVEATMHLKLRRYGRAKKLYTEFIEGTFSDVAYYKAPVLDAKIKHRWISLQKCINWDSEKVLWAGNFDPGSTLSLLPREIFQHVLGYVRSNEYIGSVPWLQEIGPKLTG